VSMLIFAIDGAPSDATNDVNAPQVEGVNPSTGSGLAASRGRISPGQLSGARLACRAERTASAAVTASGVPICHRCRRRRRV
jgi:hypothetical protein